METDPAWVLDVRRAISARSDYWARQLTVRTAVVGDDPTPVPGHVIVSHPYWEASVPGHWAVSAIDAARSETDLYGLLTKVGVAWVTKMGRELFPPGSAYFR